MTLGRKAKATIAGVTLLAIAGAGLWGWRASHLRAEVSRTLPARPDLGELARELPFHLDEAEARAKSLRGSVAGLAELARLYHANGFLAQATACERALMRWEPSNPRWPYLLAHTAGGYGNLDEAVPLLEQTIALAPDYAPARIRLGEILLKRNEPQRAAQLFQQVIEQDPENGYAILGQARAELALDQTAAARERLQRLAAEQPQFAPVWTLLISVDEQLGDVAAAEEHRAQARASGRPREMPDPWLDELMSDCYDPYRLAVAASAADPESNQARARRLLERAVAIAPQDDMPRRLLGNLLSDLGELPLARSHLERATELNPRQPDNWSHLVRVQKAMNDPAAASRTLDAGLQHCPNAPVLHLERGRRWLAGNQLERAAEAFERARQLRPEDSSAYVELAGVRFKQGRLEEGVAELRSAVKVDPSQPVALVLLARYAISTKDADAAEDWIRRCRAQPKVTAADLAVVTREFQAAFGRMP